MQIELKWVSRATLLLVAPLLIAAGCGEKEQSDLPEVVRPVKTAVVHGFVGTEQTFPGRVDAGNKLLLSFRVPGRIVELPVKKGEAVKKGQLIARLDARDYEIAVEEAKATFQRAESDFQRYKRLYETDAVPLADLDQRRSERDVAKARLDEAEKNLGYTYLRAPFGGMIGDRYVENHMDVRAQEEIVDLNDTTLVEVKVHAPENLVAMMRQYEAVLNVKVYAEFDAKPDQRYDLELKEIAARADPQTQTFELVFIMPQPGDIALLPGMTATVRLVAEVKPGVSLDLPITVPAIAIKTSPEGGKMVWVVDTDDMTVHAREVAVGSMRGTDSIEILEGLEGGEHVVIAGLAQLSEGMKVRFWEDQE
ncbi:MAG: efflux RND transporter periplasmic adaptor subunit [Candidatus Latescibacterota bacterium]|jgi:RND family efflux transporter MFP subunit